MSLEDQIRVWGGWWWWWWEMGCVCLKQIRDYPIGQSFDVVFTSKNSKRERDVFIDQRGA